MATLDQSGGPYVMDGSFGIHTSFSLLNTRISASPQSIIMGQIWPTILNCVAYAFIYFLCEEMKKKKRLRVHSDKLKKYIICNYKVVA